MAENKVNLDDLEAEAQGISAMCKNLLEEALVGKDDIDPQVACVVASTNAHAIQAIAMCRFAKVAEKAFGALAKDGDGDE